MTLLAVERIKLFTTRSPWWCALLTLVLTIVMLAWALRLWQPKPIRSSKWR